MSASFQAFPQTGPPPPGMIYPTTITTTTTSREQGSSSSQSSGSFGMVFVVLAIILVVSAVACALGRLCTKKSNKNKSHLPKAHKHSQNPSYKHDNNKHQKSNHSNQKSKNHKHGGPPRPKDRDLEFGYRSREGDIMLGFDPKARFPSAKVANNGNFRSGDLGMMGRGPNPFSLMACLEIFHDLLSHKILQ